MRRTLQQAKELLADTEAIGGDPGFGIPLLQECGIKRYVVRGAKNVVAYRAEIVPPAGSGRRPLRGAIVRPLARRYKGRLIEAIPPDEVLTWQEEHDAVTASIWHELRPQKAHPDAPLFRIVSIKDPRFLEPLLLATTLPLTPQQLRDFYVDRWPIEIVPQTAKQILGAVRQFVSADEARQRLPELALIAACAEFYAAATLPPLPSDFWDRNPQPTAGRLRRILATVHFQDLHDLPDNIRRKESVSAHLLKGVLAHRRLPTGFKRPNQPHNRKHKPLLTRN